ncbi:MAG: peptidoglycan-binding domain-containing protein [Gammaproteobacteria bacterium]
MMKLKSQWAAGALTLALVCTPLAFAGAGTSGHSQSGQSQAQTKSTQAMAGYRNWTVQEMTELQKALAAQGADVKATGHWNDETRAAVKAFQKKHGLKPTGFPNQATVKALRQKPPKK